MEIQKSFAFEVLPNGLRVIIVPRRESKTVAIQAFVGAGSFYESESQMGISHMVEHLVFEGTPSFPEQGQVACAVEDIGGDIEAETNEEYTLFELAAESSRLELLAKALGEMVSRPLFREKDLQNEKKIIIEEILRSADDNSEQNLQEILKAVYGDLPPSRQIAGTKKSVEAITCQDLQQYFQKHYVASNMVVAISGKVEVQKALDEVSKNFYFMPKGQRPLQLQIKQEQKITQLHCVYRPCKQSDVAFMFKSIGLKHPMEEAAEMLANIVGGMESSRLFKKIRIEKGLAYDVHALQRSYANFGYFCAEAGVSPKSVPETLEVLASECSRIAKLGIDSNEITKIRDFISGKIAMLTEHHLVEAQFYGRDELLENHFESVEERFSKILRLTIEDINSAASAIIKPENLNVVVVGPHKGNEQFQEIINNF